jgi:hypothetical protein
VKVAVTALEAFINTPQVEADPEQAPLQVSEYPVGIVAVKVSVEFKV